jgi:lipase chaperone LimK
MNSSMINRILGAGVVLAVLLAVWWMIPEQESVTLAAMPAAAPSAPSAAADTGRAVAMWLNKPADPAPASPAVFRLDARGNLIADSQARSRLDSVVAELPENPDRLTLQRAEQAVAAGLPATAVPVAHGILHAYLRFQKAQMALPMEADGKPLPPEQILDSIIDLRRIHLGVPVANGFFAADEAQARVGIKLAAIESDVRRSAAEKAARIEVLRNSLPAGQSGQIGPQSTLKMEADVAALRAGGAGETEIAQRRVREVGPEGAASIAAMEAEHRAWEKRIALFLRERAGMPGADSAARMQLLRRHFSEQEAAAALAYANSLEPGASGMQ